MACEEAGGLLPRSLGESKGAECRIRVKGLGLRVLGLRVFVFRVLVLGFRVLGFTV